jgi:hypothetical protein
MRTQKIMRIGEAFLTGEGINVGAKEKPGCKFELMRR